MRNVWKGMLLGALAGAGIGLAVDALEALGAEGRALGSQGIAGAKDLAQEGRAAIKEAHLPDKARDLAAQGRETLAEAELPDKVRDLATQGREAIADADLPDKARDLAAQGRDAVEHRPH